MNTLAIVIAAICAAVVIVILLLVTAMKPLRRGHQVVMEHMKGLYAHRGMYDIDMGIPENSLAAFDRAATNGYGMELDVRLTADGQLVILHDNNALRMTGEDVNISEITAERACSLSLRGTEHHIPRFEQMLETVAGRVPLLVELKINKGDSYRKCGELCEKVCRAMESYEGPYMLESFDPRAIYWLKKNRPAIARGQLVTYYRRHGDKCPPVLDFLLANAMFNIFTKPDFLAVHYEDRNAAFIRLSRKLYGVCEFQWTINSPEKQRESQSIGAVPIFERYIPESINLYTYMMRVPTGTTSSTNMI